MRHTIDPNQTYPAGLAEIRGYSPMMSRRTAHAACARPFHWTACLTLPTLAFVGVFGMPAPSATAAEPSVSTVAATYRIQLAGVKFGLYNFSSSQDGDRYSARSNAKLRAFFGAFKWRGSTSSTGRVTSKGPIANRYVYSYRRNKKATKSVTVSMAGGNVTGVAHQPPRPLNKPNRVPLTKKHFASVSDPMSAMMSLSSPPAGTNPCQRSVRVFDGQHRFNVKLTPKGSKSLDLKGARGFGRRVRVCRVQHRPIAGHKPGKKASYISDPKGTEVWLVPAAGGLIYVPYRIVVPTLLGDAVLQAATIKVTLSDGAKLSLGN